MATNEWRLRSGSTADAAEKEFVFAAAGRCEKWRQARLGPRRRRFDLRTMTCECASLARAEFAQREPPVFGRRRKSRPKPQRIPPAPDRVLKNLRFAGCHRRGEREIER